jgi:hypothetical protein
MQNPKAKYLKMKTVIPAPPAFNFQYRGTLTKFSAVDVVQLRSLRERKNRQQRDFAFGCSTSRRVKQI